MTSLSKIESNDASKIKSFQYLDTEKMYSISSQIFSGLTEYVIKSKHNSEEEVTTQKGREWNSGRMMADIIEESSNTTEKRFLHDYAYNLFEEALLKSERVLEIDKTNVVGLVDTINEKSFIKVTGQVLFNDINRVIHSIDNYNDFGYAIWYITQGKDLVAQYKEINSQANKITDRNKKASQKAKLDRAVNFKELVKEAGLYLDPDYLEKMSYVLNYGYKDQFEIQLPLYSDEDNHLFSAQLKREMLRESEDLLIRKYSVETEKKFTLFGIPTQTKGESEKLNSHRDIENASLKQAMVNLISSLSGVEHHFTGKLDYEIVIDPIAVYIEI